MLQDYTHGYLQPSPIPSFVATRDCLQGAVPDSQSQCLAVCCDTCNPRLLQVFTYDGRQVCMIRPQGLNPEGVSTQQISLSSDTLAAAVGSTVRCYETAQGRLVGEVLNHSLEVKAVVLSQVREQGIHV